MFKQWHPVIVPAMPEPDPPPGPAADPATAPRPSRYGALGYRNFRLYFAGHLTSLLGWSMHTVAVPWLVLLLTNSPFYVGLVSMLGTLPIMFLSLYGGLIADRFPRRRLLLVTQSAAMVIALGLAAAVLLDVVTLVVVMIAVTLLGVTAAFDIPGRQSFIADLVGKADLMSAVALNSASFNGSRIVGPGIAGVLIGVAGVGVCFLINGVSYVALIAALLAMRFPPTVAAPEPVMRRSTVRDGLSYVAADRRMRALVMLIAIASVFGFPFYVLLPVLARNVLGLGAVEFGWMVSAAALGALVAALGLALLGSRVPKGRTVSVAAPAFGLLVSFLGHAPSFAVLVPLLVLTGFFQVVHTATTNTLLQSIAQDELRGRVMSVYSLAFLGLMPLGSVLAGGVADRWSPAAWLSTSGLVCAGLMFLVLRWAPEIRRMR